MAQRGTSGQTAVTVHPIANYTFGTKGPKKEKDFSVHDRMARWKASYEKEGPRRTVEAILIATEHNHPHVLLLQVRQAFAYRSAVPLVLQARL